MLTLRTQRVKDRNTVEVPKFPDATNTGPLVGVTRTAYAGPQTISTANTTLSNLNVTGQLTIATTGVVVNNCRIITTTDYYGVLVNTGCGVTITDTSISGPISNGIMCNGTFTGRRLNISGCEDGMTMGNNSILADSYVHDLVGDASSHYDCVNADGKTGWQVTGNSLINPYGQTSAIWVGDPRGPNSEGLLQGNLLAGGSYTIYAGPGTGAGIRVLGNTFDRRFYSTVGQFGYVASWSATGNTWSGNVFNDGTTCPVA